LGCLFKKDEGRMKQCNAKAALLTGMVLLSFTSSLYAMQLVEVTVSSPDASDQDNFPLMRSGSVSQLSQDILSPGAQKNKKDLKLLSLSGNKCTSFDGLAEYSGLNELVLSSNNINTLVGMHALDNLVWLYLDNNKLTSLEGLPSLKSLYGLDVSGNLLATLTLPQLPQLKFLWAQNNSLKDLEESMINRLAKLRVLHLQGNQFSDPKRKELARKLPQALFDKTLCFGCIPWS